MPTTPPLAPAGFAFPNGMLQTVLDLSLTAVQLWRPHYGPDGPEPTDFTLEYLNPAGQHMLGLPEQPGITMLGRYPHVRETGIFDFYCRVLATGEAGRYDVNYPFDGLDNYFHLVAQRSGELLLVNFTDTADHSRSAVELVLRESQAREQAARAEAEAQRATLQAVLMQLPANVATHHGPDHVFGLVNPHYQQLFPERHIQGRPAREALPELAGQHYFELFDQVYETGEPFYATEMAASVDFTNTGRQDQRYYNVFFQALRDGEGRIDGLLNFAYDVTGQVLARQQVQDLNQQLAATNATLLATIEALRTQNTEVLASARHLAQEHEKHQQIFQHTPAAICIQRGPEHRYEYLNAAYQAFFPDRQFLGRPVAEALPETVSGGFVALLDEVYRTGTTYFGHESPLTVLAPDGSPARQIFFTFTYQAYREAGEIVGISTFAYDVSEQVRARQRQETQQRQMHELFEQTPVAVAVLRGPNYLIETANPAVCAMWGRTPAQAVGTPLFELLPEVAGQGFEELLDGVLATGVPFVAHELPSPIDRDGHRITVYWNFIYAPLREADGRITGVTVMATDGSEQVLARQQVQTLNQQLAAANTALSGTNAELGTNNAELRRTQHHLQQLNKKLDTRVAERTQAALAARAEAEQQRARLEHLFMAAPAAICILVGPELVYELVNPIYQQWLPGRQLLGRTVLAALPEVAAQPAYQALRRVYDTGTTFYSPAQLVPLARPGDDVLEDRYFNLVFQARYDEQGGIDGVLVFGFEVTEQVLARQAGEASARQYQLVMDALPVLIGYVDQEQKYQFTNRAYEAWFNQKPEELLGRTVREVVGEAAYEATQDYIERALAGEALDFEARMPYREDFVKHIRTSFVPDVQAGRVAGFYSLVSDVTEQVEAREAIEQQRQVLHALFMDAPMPIVILDGPALVFQLVNPAYQQIFPDRALLGNPLLVALPELVGTTVPALLGECYQTGETHTAHEMPLLLARHEGGPLEKIYWTFTYQARRTPHGTVDGVMVFAYDVTAQVQARQLVLGLNQQLAALNDKLYAANAALGHANDELGDANEELGDTNQQLTRTNIDLDTFVYTASHDLKGPITNIEGLLHALREELPPASQVGPVAQVLLLMQDSVDRFKLTIGHLTDISRLQQELGQPMPPVRLADVIHDVCLDLAPLLTETGGQLTVDVQACDTLPFAEKNLHSVVYNLLSNALKYRHPGRVPQVHIRCRAAESYWALEVQDNGLGLDITPERPLFALFQRYHSHVEGSGVGLYMVKKMVENAGGRIEVQSQFGVGSTFTVYFKR